MGTTDFEKLDLQALVKLAKEKKIKDADRLKKSQIVAALKKEEGSKPSPSKASAVPTNGKQETGAPLQERVEESKFYVGPTAPQTFKESEWTFPQGYGQDKAVLMVRDPY